ncbi:MAG: hypothetical protein RLZ55_621 [Actinomycetota bacterium]|jgi:hypothetical protein
MNTAMRMGIALGGAAVVIAGGSAFTNSNTLPAAKTLGFGETSASGVVTTKTTLTPKSGNASLLDTVVWEDNDTTVAPATHTAMLTLTVAGATTTIDADCTIVQHVADPLTQGTITCDGADTAIAGIQKVGLTVVSKAGN